MRLTVLDIAPSDMFLSMHHQSPTLEMRMDRMRTAHLSGSKQYNPLVNKPTLIYDADWGSKPSKRLCAKAILGEDRRYQILNIETHAS